MRASSPNQIDLLAVYTGLVGEETSLCKRYLDELIDEEKISTSQSKEDCSPTYFLNPKFDRKKQAEYLRDSSSAISSYLGMFSQYGLHNL